MIQLIGLLFYCVWTTHHFVIDTDFHSKGFEDRADGDEIKFLVLHYTEGNFESSLNELTKNPDKGVHYLLPAKPNESDWIVYQLVEEKYLAYHAGLSQWQNYTAINRYSVGIEIVNLGFDDPYPPKQIEVLMQLCADIIARNNICDTCVVGHSDVAPSRKIDPGSVFPWKKLYDNKIGFWYSNRTEPISCCSVLCIQRLLKMIGYNVTDTGCMDYQSRKAISAFQLHFRPADYSGDPDTETCFIASWIVQRYFPSKMASIDTNLSIGNCQSINFTDFIVRTDYQAIGHEIRPPGVNVSMIHIFSTNANLKDSLNQLSNSLYLSAHYVVPDQPTSDGWEIYQLVNESDIAYHAGLSEWQNRTGVNSISIGVAVVNKAGQPYPNEQMDILAKLLSIIQGKYEITDTCIVGHSDVSPTRSKSPGPFFQWKRLYQNKIGFWPSSSNYNESLAILRKCDVVNCLQRKLNVIGYNITLTGDFDVTTIAVMSAFQMRFRPSNYTGLADLESCAIIDALVKEYFSSNKFCSLDSTATETTTTAGKSVSRNASYFPLIFLGYYTFI